jgi:site-specific recombinase XerD
VAERLDDYLARHGVGVIAEVPDHIAGFFGEMRERRRRRAESDPLCFVYERAPALLLEQLRAKGLVAPLPKTEIHPRIAEYLSFLAQHCGLAQATLHRHGNLLVNLLTHLCVRSDKGLASITLKEIDAFTIAMSKSYSRKSMENVCGSVRGFLGYLFMQGILKRDLSKEVFAPRIYSLEGVPRSIPWQDVRRALSSFSRRPLKGCRDYAIMVLLATCGLRSNEVAGLRLEDIDWRREVIRLRRPKTRSQDEIPLVPSVGEALISYLRRRPVSPYSEIFLTLRAPIQPLVHQAISFIAGKRLVAAGIRAGRTGSHTLRHAHAMHLLRKGFSLKAIGDALGHHHPKTALVYTKGVTKDLREVATEIEDVLS